MPRSAPPITAFLTLVLAAVVLAACSSAASQPFPVPPTEDLQATVEASGSTVVPPATTREVLPTIAAAPRNISGRVLASITGDCKLVDGGTELSLHFTASAEGGRLSRVRLYGGDEVLFDSGEIAEADLGRGVTFKVEAGSQHRFRLVAESGGSSSSIGTVITCPELPSDGSS